MEFNQLRRQVLKRADEWAKKRANDLHDEVHEQLSQQGTGRIYKKAQRTHQASAPGRPPAPDQGELRRSILARKVTLCHYRVETHNAYARHLEYGTVKMEARPFLRPAFEKIKEQE